MLLKLYGSIKASPKSSSYFMSRLMFDFTMFLIYLFSARYEIQDPRNGIQY